MLVLETTPLPLLELRREWVRRACFELALRAAAGDSTRVIALFALIVHFIERGTIGSHGTA